MLASPPRPGQRIEDLQGTHTFDLKIDGVRVLLYKEGDEVLLLNRSGRDVTHRFPEIVEAAAAIPINVVVDGEVVANSNSFQDTARRDKQTKPADVARMRELIPVNFVAFDLLYVGGANACKNPYTTRRAMLEEWLPWTDAEFQQAIQISPVSTDVGIFEIVKAKGLEGVIAKRNNSMYRTGRFSDWMKWKCTSRITCIMVGYEPGTGARAHFGAAFLAVLDDTGQPIPVGRVGTGFTKSEIDHLKTELDAGRPVLVEIEALNRTKDGSLRFPVYVGLRTDLEFKDATVEAFNALPVC